MYRRSKTQQMELNRIHTDRTERSHTKQRLEFDWIFTPYAEERASAASAQLTRHSSCYVRTYKHKGVRNVETLSTNYDIQTRRVQNWGNCAEIHRRGKESGEEKGARPMTT